MIAVRGEAPSLASRPLVLVDGSFRHAVPAFNASLDGLDQYAVAYPYLADALPQLNTETWHVFPDGRMETRYRLRSGLTWQDGALLSAADFVFAWNVYSTPALGQAASLPLTFMEEILAPDPQTVVIRWLQPYAEAAALGDTFQPLPRHILQQRFEDLDPGVFGGLPFWSTEYVGLGAYMLDRWEPGSFMEAYAFDGHALGPPKIDRMRVVFVSDANAALASLLAGELHYVSELIFGDSQAATLEGQWAPPAGGAVLYAPTTFKLSEIQLRPEVADPPALLDVRVRRALAHGIDAVTANDVLNGGKGVVTSSLISPRVPFYAEIDRVITKYPFNPQRAQQLMEEAGFARGADGFFKNRDGASMDFSVSSSSSPKNEQENAVIVDSLRKSGFESSQVVYPAVQLTELEARALTPALGTRGHSKPHKDFVSAQIPRPENRWRGANRGGWANPAYDRAFEAFTAALDPGERIRNIAEMERILTAEVPVIPHWFSPAVSAHVAALKGPVARQVPETTMGILRIHAWEWR